MRKLSLSLLILLSSSSIAIAAPAPAAAPPAASTAAVKPLKIGVIDVKQVVQQSPELQSINTQLTQKYKPREQAIIQAQANFKALQDKLSKNNPVLSDAERSKLEHQLITDQANLQAMITAFQQDLDNEQNADMQKLLSQIASIVNDIAKTEHYDLILQGDSVPYMTDNLNISHQVLKRLGAKD